MNVISRVARKIIRASNSICEHEDDLQKRKQCIAEAAVHFFPGSRVENLQANPSAIRIGQKCRILGQLLVFGHGGEIRIGESCFVGEHTRIWSAISIAIGNRVLISHGVNIHDTISHSYSAVQRQRHFDEIFSTGHPVKLQDVPANAPVVIEDDAWLGFNCTVLRGVTIGRGAIVGSASVVTKSVEPFSIVVGNPARPVGQAKP